MRLFGRRARRVFWRVAGEAEKGLAFSGRGAKVVFVVERVDFGAEDVVVDELTDVHFGLMCDLEFYPRNLLVFEQVILRKRHKILLKLPIQESQPLGRRNLSQNIHITTRKALLLPQICHLDMQRLKISNNTNLSKLL